MPTIEEKGLMAGVMPASAPVLDDPAMDVACPKGLEVSEEAEEGEVLEVGAMAASMPAKWRQGRVCSGYTVEKSPINRNPPPSPPIHTEDSIQ
jgi:predicted ribosome quality control (RQC) complex YloA/Tae2 family protein